MPSASLIITPNRPGVRGFVHRPAVPNALARFRAQVEWLRTGEERALRRTLLALLGANASTLS